MIVVVEFGWMASVGIVRWWWWWCEQSDVIGVGLCGKC
jgi:hypothetical protein